MHGSSHQEYKSCIRAGSRNQTVSAWMPIPRQGCCLCCYSPSSTQKPAGSVTWLALLHLHLGSPFTRPTGLRGQHCSKPNTETTLLAEPATQSASESPVKQVFLADLPILGYFWMLSQTSTLLHLLLCSSTVLISPKSDSICFVPSKQALSKNCW